MMMSIEAEPSGSPLPSLPLLLGVSLAPLGPGPAGVPSAWEDLLPGRPPAAPLRSVTLGGGLFYTRK